MVLPEWMFEIAFGLYFLVAFFQLAIWWGVFGKLARKDLLENAQCSMFNFQCPTSIIICARNEAENLCRHLPAILNQVYDAPWELIVVDDASEDGTAEVLRAFQEKYPQRMRVLRIAEKKSPGKKHALAQGIMAATYDCFLLTDADCCPAGPNWLASMMCLLTAKTETELVLGYGPVAVEPTGEYVNSFLKRWSQYETAYVATQYFSFALAGMPYMGVGRNLALRRQVFDRVGGFAAHAHLASGDDDLLVNAAANHRNTAINLDPESFVYSRPQASFRSWLLQKRRHLSASPAYKWKHKAALAAVGASHAAFYALFVSLVLTNSYVMAVTGLFLLRLFSVFIIFGSILRVLCEPGLRWRIPLFDLLLAMHYGAVVPWFLIQRMAGEWR